MVRDLRHLLEPASMERSVIRNRPPALLPRIQRFRVYFHCRVFRCGLCGKAYATENLAWVCVAACAATEMETMAVIESVAGENRVFQCPMCLRRFLNHQDAFLCFERCRDAALAHLPAEAMRLAVVSVPGERPEALRGQELEGKRLLDATSGEVKPEAVSAAASDHASSPENALLDLVPLPEGASLDLLGLATDGEAAGGLEALSTMGNAEGAPDWSSDGSSYQLEGATDENTSSGGDGADMGDVALEGGLDFLPGGEAGPEGPVFKRKPGQKPFIRDGARYVCTACKSKYFTRQEAEQCFESHPLSSLT